MRRSIWPSPCWASTIGHPLRLSLVGDAVMSYAPDPLGAVAMGPLLGLCLALALVDVIRRLVLGLRAGRRAMPLSLW